MTSFFVVRPIAAGLLAAAILLLGSVAFMLLPVAPLPQIDFPTIQVSAKLPGASAATIETSITTPLERQLAQIPGVSEITSQSYEGASSIVVQFDLSREMNAAAQDVQSAISAAAKSLPREMTSPPTYRKANPADAMVMSLALTSDVLPLTELDRFAQDVLAPQISRIQGVGIVDFHGEARPAIRIQMDPDRAASRAITFADVRAAVAEQSVNAPKGAIRSSTRSVTIDTTDQILSRDGYKALIVAYRNGAAVRLDDVATVIDAAADTQQAAWFQDQPSVIIDIKRQPGQNIVEMIDAIRARLPELTQSLPGAINLTIRADQTAVIRASIKEVEFTILLTIALVVAVIFCFLGSVSATLIPSFAIPLSLVGTFCVIYACGYSLNIFSLMALSIAVGFVVDDAIVVIENVSRHMEMGKTRLQAAMDGSREVTATVVSMTVSLVVVFIPVLLMSGVIGRLFREFAVTVSAAILISGFVSLTVTPALCGWLLRHTQPSQGRGWSQAFQTTFDVLTRGYARALDVTLRHRLLTLVVAVAALAGTVMLYLVIPKGFMPQQDTGFIQATVRGAPDISLAMMSEKVRALAALAIADPDVENVGAWIDSSPSVSIGRMDFNLKPVGRRDQVEVVLARLRIAAQPIEGLTLSMRVRQDVQIGPGTGASALYQYTLQANDNDELTRASEVMLTAMRGVPLLRDVTLDRQPSTKSLRLEIDRLTAAQLGVSVQAIDDALYDAFGQRQVGTLFTAVNQYRVILEALPSFQASEDTLARLVVRSSTTNRAVPLDRLVSIVPTVTPVAINHLGLMPSATLSFNLAPGAALGEAVAAIRTAELSAGLPTSVIGTFQGTARAFQSSLGSQPWLILAAIVTVYIVLGMLYESLIHPLTVLSTLPSAGLGALGALMLTGYDLSIIATIGIVMLIGIVKKNAIMMIDFALTAEMDGASPEEAIRQACLQRFRPIMMTTVAALFGALPLAFATGDGSELRGPLGVVIVGGLAISQVLTLFTTPAIYLSFSAIADRWNRRRTHQHSAIYETQFNVGMTSTTFDHDGVPLI